MTDVCKLPEDRRAAANRALNDAGLNSHGPNLADMADTVLCAVAELDLEDQDASDSAHEIADGAVPTYTGEIMEAISEDAGLASSESEVGPAFDGEATPVNVAAGVLYDLALQIANAAIEGRREKESERRDELEDAARERGEEAAKAAATWVTDGNAHVAERALLLGMLRDGDPAADNYLPKRPDLSGEAADDPTPLSLARELAEEDDPPSDLVDALAEAFENGVGETFGLACEAELIKFCEPDKEDN